MTRLILVGICLVILSLAVYINRPVMAAGGDDPAEACEKWRTAGGVDLYRCVDEEQYIVCYSQSVMLFCLPQQ